MKRDKRGRPRGTRGRDRNAFAKWVDSTEMTFQVVAAFLRVSLTSVQEWYAGRSIPKTEMALRIERMSEGKVAVASWVRRRRKPGGAADPGGDAQAAS